MPSTETRSEKLDLRLTMSAKRVLQSAALAEAGTCIVFSVHREEVRALDRGMAADHRELWPGETYGDRGIFEVGAWHGTRARQRTGRLDARR